MTSDFPYRPLGGRNRGIFQTYSLWLADDHLLTVHNQRFVELYSRIYLREIQAIVICKRARFIVPAYWFLACFFASVSLIVGEVSRRGPVIDGSWLALGILVVAWVGVSLFASCSAHVQTAVGVHELPSLHRIWNARRILRTLEEKIGALQGELPESWEPDDPVDLSPGTPAATPAAPSSMGIISSWAACAALLLDALVSWLVRFPAYAKTLHVTGVGLTLSALVLSIAALIFTRKDKDLRALRPLMFIAMGVIALANYVMVIINAFTAALQKAQGAQIARNSNISDFFYWFNQIGEVSVAILIIIVLLRRPAREPLAP